MNALRVAVLAVLLGCGSTHDYVGIGRVIAVDRVGSHITIDHEDIPGLMGAMTMQFAVASPELVAHVAPGARVRFVFRDASGTLVVTRLTPLD